MSQRVPKGRNITAYIPANQNHIDKAIPSTEQNSNNNFRRRV